jgi:hypothetical protein
MSLFDSAKVEMTARKTRRFRVTTINWTVATERGVRQSNKVHRNVYHWTLPYLIRWIRDTAEVWEDIVSIEPLPAEERRPR